MGVECFFVHGQGGGTFLQMPKVFLKTYGCQMNERDSEQVARDLISRGYVLTDAEKEADDEAIAGQNKARSRDARLSA